VASARHRPCPGGGRVRSRWRPRALQQSRTGFEVSYPAEWDVPRIEVGYFVVQAQTGKGYATEAARATVRFAFEHLGVLRVELQCRADNLASKRVAERCGFVYEGRMRQRHRKKAGDLVDVLWYGLLRSEWQDSVVAEPLKR
jgi:RimJ/RimL family protein N-acetyltransferase